MTQPSAPDVPADVPTAASSTPSLRRALGRWDLTAIGINQVVGGAIFLMPAQVAAYLGGWSPLAVLLVGLSSLFVALCFAEVGSRFETTGGTYVYTRAAFGRFVGFEVGWMQWFTRVASLASVANGIVLATSAYVPSLASEAGRMTFVSALTAALTAINLLGIRQSAWVVNALTLAKLVPLVCFILVGLWFVSPAVYATAQPIGELDAAAAALLLVFTFGGFDVVGVPAGEARVPRRDVPFAFLATVGAVTVIFTLVQVVAMGTAPDVAHARTPLADAAFHVAGPLGALAMAVGAVVSMTGNNAGQILSGSRMLFGMAERGELPRVFAHVHPRFRTPDVAIIVTAVVALALALSGSFAKLAAVSAVARLMAYAGAAAATLALRRRDATGDVPPATFRVPLGPTIPLLALLTSIGILAGATPAQLTAGAAALAAGAALFALASATRRPDDGSKTPTASAPDAPDIRSLRAHGVNAL